MTPELTLPTLDASTTVALLVAADPATAPAAAWALARHCAGDRQTALIDLALGAGALDAGADDPGAEGIVDVFEFGASWNHVARRQGTGSLYFVPDGTPAADPHAIWGHARWEKLRRGFQQQGALLLLYVPARALADLAPRADAVVLLGDGPAAATARALAAGRDLPLLGPVLVERPAPDPEPAPAPMEAPVPSGEARWLPWAVGIVVALGVFGTAFVLLRPEPVAPPVARNLPARPAAPATTDTTPPAPAATAPVPAEPAAPAPPAGDTLFCAVQVAAFNRLPPARALTRDLEAAGRTVALTPVLIGRVTWYRVLVGALPTPAAASRARADLWQGGLLERGQGAVLRVPHAWALGTDPDDGAAQAMTALRRRGIPAYIVSGPDVPRLYLGAFETPEQAAAAESLLTAAGRPHTLVVRRGTTR